MPDQTILEQARFIFRVGKMMRDRFVRCHTDINCRAPFSCDLSMHQMYAVLVTKERGQLTISELADIMTISPPSASALVDRLVEKGVLTRRHSKEDRRKVVIQVSPNAIGEFSHAEERLLSTFVDLVEKVGPDVASQWCNVLQKVYAVLIQDSPGTANAQVEQG